MARDKKRPNLAAQWICVRSPFSRTGRVLEKKAVQNIYAVRQLPTKDFWTRSLPACIFFSAATYGHSLLLRHFLLYLPSLLFSLFRLARLSLWKLECRACATYFIFQLSPCYTVNA
jgi:hypothetical protein